MESLLIYDAAAAAGGATEREQVGGYKITKTFQRLVFRRASSSSSPIIILLCLLLLLLFSFISLILFLHKVQGIISHTKTVAGHNLDPTPWHPFPITPAKKFIDDNDNDPDNEDKRAGSNSSSSRRWWWGWYPLAPSTILRCSYLLRCGPVSSLIQQQQQPQQHKQFYLSSPSCPSFFHWIHHDLAPWTHSRISISNLMEAREHAAFRIIIASNRLYADFYYACVQSRAMFTVWGLLQLLRRYPGMIPDTDLMFDCMDKPVINRSEFKPTERWPPPPLFRYCNTKDHFDIPFPDWSFWGWPEVNIGPWDEEFRSIKLGSQDLKWEMKKTTAYWKGNPDVSSPIRMKLLECNDSRIWGAEIMRQNWVEEARRGFEESKLASQCNHRYKIYAEGYAWSVSLKYIVSCGSLALIIHPQYEDFFSRGLMPRKNYWPLSPTNLCPSIKFAVDWGNKHPLEAEAIGKGGQDFMQNLNMDQVYDYMYHLIVEYSKLLDFKPTPPSSAQEMCEDSLLCFASRKQRQVLKKSSASSSSSPPCKRPSPDHHLIKSWMQEKQRMIDDIQKLETVEAKKRQ